MYNYYQHDVWTFKYEVQVHTPNMLRYTCKFTLRHLHMVREVIHPSYVTCCKQINLYKCTLMHFYRHGIYFIELKSMKCQEHICHVCSSVRPSLLLLGCLWNKLFHSSHVRIQLVVYVYIYIIIMTPDSSERVSVARKLHTWTLLFTHESTYIEALRHVSSVSLNVHYLRDSFLT